MAEYRKKPVVVDAIENTGEWDDIQDWLDEFETPDDRPIPFIRMEDGAVLIETIEGQMRADKGDYIIRGLKGEFYPCKPDIFHMTYEEA